MMLSIGLRRSFFSNVKKSRTAIQTFASSIYSNGVGFHDPMYIERIRSAGMVYITFRRYFQIFPYKALSSLMFKCHNKMAVKGSSSILHRRLFSPDSHQQNLCEHPVMLTLNHLREKHMNNYNEVLFRDVERLVLFLISHEDGFLHPPRALPEGIPSENVYSYAVEILKFVKTDDCDINKDAISQLVLPLLRLTVKTGSLDGALFYAQLLLEGIYVKKNTERGLKLLKALVAQDHGDAAYILGRVYRLGLFGITQDLGSALELFELSASQESSQAFAEQGHMYRDGIGVQQDDQEAVRLYEKGSIDDDPGAHCALAHMYTNGRGGLHVNFDKAFEYYMKATKKNYPLAEFNVGCAYFLGKGIEADIAKAADYFETASKMGFSMGTINTALMYIKGLGVEQDLQKAKELLGQIANDSEHAESLLKEIEEKP